MLPPSSQSAGVDVPAAWLRADVPVSAGAESVAQWWLRMGDPLMARLVAQALRSNGSVAQARASLKQSRALRDAAAAGLLPGLDGSASAQRGRSGGGETTNSFKAGLDASWELDVFGANRSAVRSAAATAQASAAALGDVQVSIAAEVALGYISLRSAQARLAIANDNLASQQEILQITLWRQQAGLVSSLEAEQSRAAADQTRAQLPALRTSIEQAMHAIAVMTGQPPATLAGVLSAATPVPQPAAALALSIPAETLRQRPDVRAAEHRVAAAAARVSQARAQTLPSFRLTGSLGLSALSLGALTGGGSVASAILAGISMPLFDGGAARAHVRAEEAALEQAHAQHRAAVLVALKEVEDALVALRGDRERLVHLQAAAQAASNAALLARQRFASGLVDFQVVLETQRTQLNTQDGVSATAAEVSADHVRLYKTLGGGWRPDGDDELPAANTATDEAFPS